MTHILPEAARAEKRKTPPTRILIRARGSPTGIISITHLPFSCRSLYLNQPGDRFSLFHASAIPPTPAPTVFGSPVSAHIAMSLTSRVFGLFSTTAAPADSTTTAQTPAPLAHHEISLPGATRHARGDHLFDEEEEEPRPPYPHV